MTARRRLVASGIAAVALYLTGAAISGHLSPLARRPLLDGIAPPAPYRWVDPPPELAADNREPTPGAFDLATDATDATAVFTTDDAQVTLLVSPGAFDPPRDTRRIELTVDPIAPSETRAPDPPLEIVGNVIRVDAAAVPGDEPLDVVGEVRVVLVYPFEAGQHGAHTIVSSPDGERWTPLQTNDLPSIQQTDAVIPTLGYIAVAREPGASPTAAPEDADPATVAIVAGVAVLAVAIGAALWWRRRRAEPPRGGVRRRPGRGAGTGSRRGSSTRG